MADVPDFSGSGPVEYRPEASASGPVAAPAGRDRLLGIPGVVSVGLGQGPAGGEAVVVSVTDAGVAARLPRMVDGLPVEVVVTGEVGILPVR